MAPDRREPGSWGSVVGVVLLNWLGMGAGYLRLGRWKRAILAAGLLFFNALLLYFINRIPLWAIVLFLAYVLLLAGAILADSICTGRRGPIASGRFYQKPVLYALCVAMSLALGFSMEWAKMEHGPVSFDIPSASMQPTLMIGDRLFASGVFGEKGMQRGDVVIYRRRFTDGDFYVGRIVAMSGETFQMVGGVPHVDGRPFAQREKEWISVEDGREMVSMRVLEETTPEGKSYLIGMITTRMFLDDTETFAVPAGHVVILGDNRQNSFDSRLKEVGPIPAAAVMRKVGLIFWADSWSRIGSLVQ